MKNLSIEEVKKIFSDSGCQLLSDYNKCDIPMSYICKCGKEGLITLDKFKRRLKKGGNCRYCKTKDWSEEEDECLKKFYGKVSRRELLDLLPNTTYNELKNRAYKLNLQGNRSLVQSQARKGKGRKYDIDFSFFDVVDPLRSYWAGFVAAVGNLNDSRKRLAIRLPKKDKIHLESFKLAVGYTGRIHDVPHHWLIQIHGIDRWLDQLKSNYGLTPRKSLTLEPPVQLDELNSLAFIIGYLDGHGCITYKEKDISIQLIGTRDLLCWIKTWFDIWCPSIQRRYAVVRPGTKGNFVYKISGRRADYLLRKMNDVDVPKMIYKWKQVG